MIVGANLRDRLREDTRVAHETLDRVVSDFDLADNHGLVRFLGMQYSALSCIAPLPMSDATRAALTDLLERADHDLRGLNTTTLFALQKPIMSLHPLAIDYVFAGSRLGTQVLKKRWLAATDKRVKRARAYFTAPSYVELWKSFCASAQMTTSDDDVADQVVRDANRIFNLYHACARTPEIVKESLHA